ncbi:two-component system sensor histidine kinase NtrB [Desulfogranum marinum]|uniref:two-component system sensor histidine kinase NtrB n=1 Tax=Desulfogranum marinum TaxID=453220 RepID=UPI001964B599|nr:ATP-binding protein [Desulfogranum marinum]MBM9511113.1 GHKL domain-containing protein [Desulfogranum marinum]
METKSSHHNSAATLNTHSRHRTGNRLHPGLGSFNTEASQSTAPTWDLNQIIDRIDVGIVVLDVLESVIEYQNPLYFELIGEVDTSGDFEKIYSLFFDQKEVLAKRGVPDTISGMVKHNDKVLGYSIYHIAERYCAIFIRDITERMRLEAIAQAANSIDNLGFIFSGIRHEVGNPLNSLKMTLSVLRQNLNRFSQQTVEEYVDRSLADIGRVEYLLKSLKNFSMFEVVNVTDIIIQEYLKTFQSLAEVDLRNRGILFTLDISASLRKVQIDPRAMNQVLLNIISNAADALEKTSAPEIHLTGSIRDNILWITVKDNGCGISPEQKKRLFQPFNSSKPSGNGLGLVITQKLLARMDSSIDIESTVGEGTCVTIGLPVSQEDNL